MTFSSEEPEYEALQVDDRNQHTHGWQTDQIMFIKRKNKQCFILSMMIVFIFMFVVAAFFLGWNYFKNDGFCTNTVIIENSLIHKGNVIDPDINPCEDFYTFACGRWNLSASQQGFTSVIEEAEVRTLLRLESYLRCSSFRNETEWGRYMKNTFDLCEKGRTASIRTSRTVAFVREMAEPLFSQNHESLDFTLRRVHHILLQTGLFRWDMVLGNDNDMENYVVRLAPPDLPKKKDFTFFSRNRLANYIREVLLLLGAESNSIEKQCEGIAEVSFAIDENLEQADFDKKNILHKFTYKHFVADFDFMNFSDYFQGYSISENIYIENLEYFEWLKTYFKKRNDGSVQDLVIWSAIDFFIPYMPNEFLEIRRKYSNRDSSRSRSLMEESHPCVHIVNSGLKFATASYFMKKTIDTKAREIVDEIVRNVKNSFRGYVNEIRKSFPEEREWFDGLGLVFRNIMIGVPDRFQQFYEEKVKFPAETKSFPSYLLSAHKSVLDEIMNHLNETPYAALYRGNFLQVNGAFLPTPMVFVYLGILTPPFFDPHQPLHLNYGGLGWALSHELAHSIIHLGSRSTPILNDFKLKFLCLQSIHAKSTLRNSKPEEDFADAVAIQIAYNAYLEHYSLHNPNREPTIMEKKLFFLHYSQFFCESNSTFNSEMDPLHSPSKERINVPLSNFPQFSKTFSCPKGSPMHMGRKCIL